jgi:uncharacterized membrane protein YbhN (UPF0104 family)
MVGLGAAAAVDRGVGSMAGVGGEVDPDGGGGGGEQAAVAGTGVWAWIKRVVPWGIAAAILWLLFRRVPFEDALRAVDEARLEVFVPAVLVAVTLWFWLESTAFARLFSRFNAPVSRSEARSLRAVTYLVTPINWNLGTGAIILHLRRSKGIAALEATSSMLFYGLIDGLTMGSLMLVGVWMLPASATLQAIGRVAAVIVGVQLLILAFFWLRGPDWRWVRRIKAFKVFRTHGLAGWRDVAFLLAIRTLYFGCFVLFFWVGTGAFHVDVPLLFMTAAVPVILATGALPITPAGLGTQQAVMLYFFAPFGTEAQILAYGLAFPVALSLGRVILGLFYIGDLRALRA